MGTWFIRSSRPANSQTSKPFSISLHRENDCPRFGFSISVGWVARAESEEGPPFAHNGGPSSLCSGDAPYEFPGISVNDSRAALRTSSAIQGIGTPSPRGQNSNRSPYCAERGLSH